MIVLGFDTATPSTAVGLRLAEGHTIEERDDPLAGDHPGHATRLLAMAHDLLGAAGITWDAIERLAVGVGPGTFTGLRVGIATARGLAQSLAAELVGVSSLQALAAPALLASARGHEVDPGEAPSDAVLAVIDARRGEAFAGAYETGGRGAPPVELVAARALAPADLGAVLAAAVEQGVQPDRRWLAVGDGAVRFRDHLERLGVKVAPDSSPLHHVSAVSICEIGAHAEAAAGDEQILPDYRRRPDAEIALETASAGGLDRG